MSEAIVQKSFYIVHISNDDPGKHKHIMLERSPMALTNDILFYISRKALSFKSLYCEI